MVTNPCFVHDVIETDICVLLCFYCIFMLAILDDENFGILVGVLCLGYGDMWLLMQAYRYEFWPKHVFCSEKYMT